MKCRKKRLTKELIRKYFGSDAKVLGFGGHYRVKTPSGGEVVLSSKQMKVVFGGSDTYRALTLIMGELGGEWKARGSREYMLGMSLHGELEGVNIRPDCRDPWAAVKAIFVLVIIFCIGLGMGAGNDGDTLLATLLMAVAAMVLMKRGAKQEAQRKAEQLGFHYPRVYGNAGSALKDDAKREGWL